MFNFFKLLENFRQAFFKKTNNISYSQFGEDKILKEIINNNYKEGFYVDVGCFHPKKYSNTYFLYKRGWRGINIDVEKDKIDVFNLVRKGDHNVLAAISCDPLDQIVYTYGKYDVNTRTSLNNDKFSNNVISTYNIISKTLNDVIEKSIFRNREIDLLNIDVEGNDFDVLKSLDINKHNPKIIIIESHYKKINDVINSNIYNYLIKHNYSLRSWCFYSLIFVCKKSAIINSR